MLAVDMMGTRSCVSGHDGQLCRLDKVQPIVSGRCRRRRSRRQGRGLASGGRPGGGRGEAKCAVASPKVERACVESCILAGIH